MTRRQELAKEVREWRIQKIARYIGGLIFIVLGILIFIQSFLNEDATQNAWQFIVGFFIAISGFLIFAEAWHQTFKDYLKEKKIR